MAALPQDMDDLLLELDVLNMGMRANLIQAGYDTFDALVGQDEKYAHSVCQVVRKMQGQPADQTQVPVSVEIRLSKMVILATYRYITRRAQNYDNVTTQLLDHVFDWTVQKVQSPEESIEKYSEGIDIRRWFESIEQYLAVKRGVRSNVPLLYVVKALVILPADEDNTLGEQTDLAQDVARKGRLDGRFYTADNQEVWLLLKSKCHGTAMWSTISRYERISDGRNAYLALRTQLMGRDVQSHIQTVANKTLQALRYDGKSRNFSFTKFVSRFRQAAEDLGPDDQMSQRRMVKLLLEGFQVPSLQHIKDIIRTNPFYSENFENCVTYISETLLTAGVEKTTNNTRTVAAVGTTTTQKNSNGKREKSGQSGSKKKKQRGGGREKPAGADTYDPNDPTRWLKPEVFKALPEETKKKIQDAHAAKRQEKGKKKREAKAVETSVVEVAEEPPAAAPARTLQPMPEGATAVRRNVHWAPQQDNNKVPDGYSIQWINGQPKLVKN
jgi:hypothetical protein